LSCSSLPLAEFGEQNFIPVLQSMFLKHQVVQRVNCGVRERTVRLGVQREGREQILTGCIWLRP
jgi:hypothetical protein